MKKGTKLPVTYNGKVVGEAEVLDRENGPIDVTITDSFMNKLVESNLVDGVSYSPIHGSLEIVVKFKACEPHTHTNVKKKEN